MKGALEFCAASLSMLSGNVRRPLLPDRRHFRTSGATNRGAAIRAWRSERPPDHGAQPDHTLGWSPLGYTR